MFIWKKLGPCTTSWALNLPDGRKKADLCITNLTNITSGKDSLMNYFFEIQPLQLHKEETPIYLLHIKKIQV